MAASDYQDFINLMLDFRDGFDYDCLEVDMMGGNDGVIYEGDEEQEND